MIDLFFKIFLVTFACSDLSSQINASVLMVLSEQNSKYWYLTLQLSCPHSMLESLDSIPSSGSSILPVEIVRNSRGLLKKMGSCHQCARVILHSQFLALARGQSQTLWELEKYTSRWVFAFLNNFLIVDIAFENNLQ